MGRRKSFWHRWHQVHQSSLDEVDEKDLRHKTIWRDFFAHFLGMPPEKHWLFRGRRFKPWRIGPPFLFNPFVAEVLSQGGGLLALYVLHLLGEQPRYGNEIMRELKRRTQGQWMGNPGAIYPLLSTMENRGFVEGSWEEPKKRTRRMYQLTESGDQELERLKEVMRPKLEEAIGILRELHHDLV
jgi:DNA-binding PadR family transcriptional regulator